MTRLFALDMRPEQAAFLKDPGALAQVLGVPDMDLDMTHAEIFPVSDLEDIGLSGYLTEGLGLAPADVAEHSADLNALAGHVLILRSRALRGAEARLTPADQIQLITSFGIPRTNWTSNTPIETESAKPFSSPRTPPRIARKQARNIGASLFAGVMTLICLLIYLMVRP